MQTAPRIAYKKRPEVLVGALYCLNPDYSMTFGKVSTFASDTHWVTAAV